MAIEDDIKFLERVPMLRLVGRAGLRILAIGSETRYVHGGEVLFHKDQPADGGYVVQEGSFSLRNPDSERQPIVLGPGSLIGELALLTETNHNVTATAIEPTTVFRIPRTLFTKMLEGYPDAARRIRDHVAVRADQSMRDLLGLRDRMDDGRRRS
ncbi:MAG: cyclic nucleotide-binding domain-containing protein [Pseudorhodoplanes sp.]|nr:HTH-type transcriptional regulator Cmr [Pseudorhodoplanes sp.]MBW7950693.1 cyclic nucleotide-binding domain-containing protein [Pseudorhodoplanes sp.]MCL4709895.1 cyclic nucleotide-binding domain-containing protein [Pseudorhodoplanes sp.]MCQ3943321.1 Crp/Fnr family transcriptional regulator [Alphaproteobacteria bacterium]